jgi:hypothetical protein
MRKEVTRMIACRSSKIGTDEKEGAKMAIQIMSSQQADKTTSFNIDGVRSVDLLPGGVPVIDHLAAFFNTVRGFGDLKEPLELIRKARIPSPEQVEATEVREIVLGVSTGQDMRDAAAWMYQKTLETRETYNGLAVLAADVEDISFPITEEVSNKQVLLESIHRALKSGREPFRMHQLPRPKYDCTLVSFPVLFMYGAIGWQLHLRINVSYHIKGWGDKQTTEVSFVGGDLPFEEYRELIAQLEPATGTGIVKDYQDFFYAVEGVFGIRQLPRNEPFELERLAKLAGADHPQTS